MKKEAEMNIIMTYSLEDRDFKSFYDYDKIGSKKILYNKDFKNKMMFYFPKMVESNYKK